MKKITLAAGLALAMASAANAQSTATETVSNAADAVTGVVASLWDGWSGTATLGATSTTGNAEASSISGNLRVGKTVGQWEHLLTAGILSGSQTVVRERVDADGNAVEDTAGNPIIDIFTSDASKRYSLGYQPKFYWRPNTYFFGILDWEQDEPSNIDLSTRQIIGIGHRFWSTPQGYLSGEAGFGNKVLEPVTGSDLNGGIAYLGLNYLNRMSENTTFNADLRADLGGDNTYMELGLGLAYKISERLALKVSYFTRGNTDLENPTNPLDSDNDSVTTFNLVLDI